MVDKNLQVCLFLGLVVGSVRLFSSSEGVGDGILQR